LKPSAQAPASFLRDHRHLLPARGRALDVAMGSGANAVYLAGEGFTVCGVDRDEEAVARACARARELGVAIETRLVDLESEWPFTEERFDLVVVFRYLQRTLFRALETALAPGGLLVYETFTEAHARYRPMRPAFLLRPGELLHAFPGLRVLAYREVDLPEGAPDGGRAVASLIAEKA
jgi:SAM-dependent methyltransferase